MTGQRQREAAILITTKCLECIPKQVRIGHIATLKMRLWLQFLPTPSCVSGLARSSSSSSSSSSGFFIKSRRQKHWWAIMESITIHGPESAIARCWQTDAHMHKAEPALRHALLRVQTEVNDRLLFCQQRIKYTKYTPANNNTAWVVSEDI